MDDVSRHELYISELFARTESINRQLTGASDGAIKIAFTADAGEANDNQALLGARFTAEDPHIALFGGDNNYETGSHLTIENNWSAFSDQVNKGIAFPALGNHDLDTGDGINQTNKFTYISGNKRYYHIYDDNASMDIYVLNSGVNTSLSMVEPDGNTVGSVQYNWFLNEVANSFGMFKMVMFHHPFVSGVTNGAADNRVVSAMDWSFEGFGIDLILNGHTHTSQHLNTRGVDIIDASSAVKGRRAMSNSGTIYGSDAAATELVWAYAGPGATGDRLYVTIDVVGRALIVSFKRTDTGVTVYSFPIIKS